MRFLFQLLERFKQVKPSATTLRRLAFVAAFVGCTAVAFWYGRHNAPEADADQVGAVGTKAGDKHKPSAAYRERVVAEIYGLPITREDLGEFLIDRFGVERVESFVNRKIVERECRAHGVEVTDLEVEAHLKKYMTQMGVIGMTEEEFATNFLKRVGKTLVEWKEDVIRPQLALTKLARGRVKVEEADVKKAFETRYGPRVEVRLICFLAEDRQAEKKYQEAKLSEEHFSHHARTQPIQHLANMGGKVPPIHKHFPDKDLEKEAFSLKEGEVSKLMIMPDKTFVFVKCDRHLPAEPRLFEDVRLSLDREIFEQKLNAMVPQIYDELRKRANPQIYLAAAARAAAIEVATKKTTLGLPEPAPPPK